MLITGKTKTLIYAAVAVLGIAILATVIGSIQFRPGDPSFFYQFLDFRFRGGSAEGLHSDIPLGRILAVIIIALAVLVAVVLIFFPKLRKRFLKRLAIALITGFLILFIASRLLMNAKEPEGGEELRSQLMKEFSEETTESAEFTVEDYEPEPSQPLIILTSVVLVLGGAVGVFFLWRRLQKNRQTPPARELSKKAQEALERVDAGNDFKNTVIRCYVEMSEIIGKYRGIRRKGDMTPREFESVLLEAGFPVNAIDRLTVLFERVRYGAEQLDRDEEKKAVDCLTTVAQSCGGNQ